MEKSKLEIAVIQAGGKGTRLRELTGDSIPKPMLAIAGKAILERQIEHLASEGIQEIVIVVGYLHEKVEEYFATGERYHVNIHYIVEEEALGSAGALYYAKKYIGNRDFLLLFGDLVLNVDIDRFYAFHRNKQALASLFVHPNTHPYDSDLIELDKESRVVAIHKKNLERDFDYKNIVNAGLSIVSAELLDTLKEAKKTDFEHELVMSQIPSARIYGYISPEYVKDAGTVERFKEAEQAINEGIVENSSLKKMQKAIFLDRDGTINVLDGFIANKERIRLLPKVPEAIIEMHKLGFLVIVITNQPVVARGMCSIEDVEDIHKRLEVLLGKEGAYIDDIKFCPHHPDKGFPEENPIYKIECECRKPNTGMIKEMVEKYHIDISKSYMIGDSTMDIKCAENAGLHSILVKTGLAGQDGKYQAKAEVEVDDLLAAVRWIASLSDQGVIR